MNYFLITYHFREESEEEWQQEVKNFIAALENDPELHGRVAYRCLKSTKTDEYFHLATTADEGASKLLSERDFFQHYTKETERVSGGSVRVVPLALIAETAAL